MLKVFRDNLKYLSWILWAVILVFVLFVFVDFGAVVPGGPGAPDATAATVGSDKVTYAEFDREYRALEFQYREIYGEGFSNELARQLRLPLIALDRLINRKILLAEARRMGLRATDEEVRRRILDYPAFQDEQGRFVGESVYSDILRSSGYTVAAFEEAMRQEVLLERLSNILRQNLYIPDEELERAHREQTERAKIRYIELPRTRFQNLVEITRDELQAYYDAHKQEYFLPEQRVVTYLLVDNSRLREQISIPEEELRRYYGEHQEEFREEEQVRARHILIQVNDERSEEEAREATEVLRRRIERGEDFAALARELSEDTGTRDRGGDLGFFGRNRMVQEFEQAAFGASPGTLVGPIRSPFGYHLLEVLERKPERTRLFEEVRNLIRSRLVGERLESEGSTLARDLHQRIVQMKLTTQEQLQSLATGEPAVSFEETPPFGRQDVVPGIGRGRPFLDKAFELKMGEVSEPIRLPRGWAILSLKEVLEPRQPPLSEMEEKVRQAILREKSQKLAMDRLEELRQRIETGETTLDAAAEELGLPVKETDEFGRTDGIQGLGANPQVAKLALELNPGEMGGPLPAPQGALLFQVTHRKRWDPVEFQREKENLQAELEQEKLNQLLGAIVEQRRRELNVRHDRRFLEAFELLPEAA